MTEPTDKSIPAVLGQEAHSPLNASARCGTRQSVSFYQNLSALGGGQAEQNVRQLGPPGAHQARDTEHFATVQREADIVDHARL